MDVNFDGVTRNRTNAGTTKGRRCRTDVDPAIDGACPFSLLGITASSDFHLCTVARERYGYKMNMLEDFVIASHGSRRNDNHVVPTSANMMPPIL